MIFRAAIFSLALSASTVLFAEQAPAFHLEDIDGKTFDLKEHIGREVVLLDFWATFCVPCLSALDHYRDLQKQYPNFQIAAISVDQPQTMARVRSFAKAKAFPFSVLLDPEQQVYRLYNVSVLPTTILINREGQVIYRKEGFEPGDEKELERRVSMLMTGLPVLKYHVTQSPPCNPNMICGSPLGVASSADSIHDKPVPPSPGKELLDKVSLSGSNFMRANYGKENRDDPANNGWLEDWFDFRIGSDKLSYQARFRAYQFLDDKTIRNPTDRLVKQTFAYDGDHADIRAGNLYGSLNQGILLHFFEDRQARIDRDMKGAWASLSAGNASSTPGLGRGRISVFGGNTYSSFADLYTNDAEEDARRDIYLQGLEGEWEPQTGMKVGSQYLEAFRKGWHVKLAGGNWQQLWGPTSLYLAYVGLVGHDDFNFPNDYHGRALYGSLSENWGQFEVGGELKYYYNYDLSFTNPPSLVKYHTFRLMARDMLFSNNQAEQGGQVHGTWHFRGEDFYSVNVSDIVSHPERDPGKLISHVSLPYIDLDQSLQLSKSKRGTLLLDLDWNHQRKAGEGSFDDINALNAGITATKPLRGPWTLQGEAELQRRYTDYRRVDSANALLGKLGGVGAVYDKDNPWQGVLSATLGRNSAWTFTLDYEVTTSKILADTNSIHYKLPGITNGWASAYFTYSALEGNQISLWFGQRQERVVCSGGSCRLEPAFEGTELIWITHF